MKKYLLTIIINFVVIGISSAQNNQISIDTNCMNFKSGYSLIGNENLSDYNWDNKNLNIQVSELIFIDTISITEFKQYKTHNVFLNTDSSLLAWTDTSFTLNSKNYNTGIDYGGTYYYLGFNELLQAYFILDVGEGVESMSMIDKLTGNVVYFESPSDYSIQYPSISTDTSILSFYVNCNFENISFISFISVNINDDKYCLHDLVGFQMKDAKIEDLVWIEANKLVMSVIKLDQNGRDLNKYYLKLEIKNNR